jgi:hypothetical protein
MKRPRSSPVATPNAQSVTPPNATTSRPRKSQAIAANPSTPPAPPGGQSLPGYRETADVWDWYTFTATEWKTFTPPRYEEFRPDELVTSEHWTHGRTQLGPREQQQERPPTRATVTAPTASQTEGNHP